MGSSAGITQKHCSLENKSLSIVLIHFCFLLLPSGDHGNFLWVPFTQSQKQSFSPLRTKFSFCLQGDPICWSSSHHLWFVSPVSQPEDSAVIPKAARFLPHPFYSSGITGSHCFCEQIVSPDMQVHGPPHFGLNFLLCQERRWWATAESCDTLSLQNPQRELGGACVLRTHPVPLLCPIPCLCHARWVGGAQWRIARGPSVPLSSACVHVLFTYIFRSGIVAPVLLPANI